MNKKVVLAGGCFWGLQELIRKQAGVVETRVGYAGGAVNLPSGGLTYQNHEGHAEAVEITYDNKKTTYIVFKLITPSCGATTKEFFQSQGIEPETQPEFCGPFQKWVWDDDTFEVLQKEFHEMVKKIEDSKKNK